MKLRRLVGILKDNAAVSRAVANSEFSSLHVAILRATSHEEAPPQEKHVAAILSAGGSSSRLRVSRCVVQLLKRLNATRNWAVALKSLILVHRTLRDGSFIFQDQLSLYPFRDGHNYLNLSDFRDRSSPATWQASGWIRCYASYVDQWLTTCRVLGEFLGRALPTWTLTGLTNDELARELEVLRDLLAAACDCCAAVVRNPVVLDALRLVLADAWQLQGEVLRRLEELRERMVGLAPGEAVYLLQVVEGLAAQEEAFGGLLNVDLAALECVHVTMRVSECVARVRESLKAVSGFKPLVTRNHMGPSAGHVSQSARFVRESAVSFCSGSARFAGVMVSDYWNHNGNESLI